MYLAFGYKFTQFQNTCFEICFSPKGNKNTSKVSSNSKILKIYSRLSASIYGDW